MTPYQTLAKLYDRLIFWVRVKYNHHEAEGYCEQMEEILGDFEPHDPSIALQSYWSMLFEARKQYELAIVHKEREIESIRKALLFMDGDSGLNEEYLADTEMEVAYLCVLAGKLTEAQSRSRMILQRLNDMKVTKDYPLWLASRINLT